MKIKRQKYIDEVTDYLAWFKSKVELSNIMLVFKMFQQ